MKRLSSWALSLLAGMLAASGLSSCNNARYYQFAARSSAYHQAPVAARPAPASANVAGAAVVQKEEETARAASAEATPGIVANASAYTRPTAPPAPAAAMRPVAAAALAAQLEAARASQPQGLSRAQQRRYERVLTKVREVEEKKAGVPKQADVAEVIVTFFIPPLGVYLHEGRVNSKFWISLLLTLIFLWLPGMIYSMLVVFDKI